MNTTQRREWLDALALGDLVIVSGREEFAATVLRRPLGRIIVGSPKGEFVFSFNGVQRGGDRYWPLRLEPMTDAWRAEHQAGE